MLLSPLRNANKVSAKLSLEQGGFSTDLSCSFTLGIFITLNFSGDEDRKQNFPGLQRAMYVPKYKV
jgi:hypothetical protein